MTVDWLSAILLDLQLNHRTWSAAINNSKYTGIVSYYAQFHIMRIYK